MNDAIQGILNEAKSKRMRKSDRDLIAQTLIFVAAESKEVYVNFINTGAAGPYIKQILEAAGYISDAPGNPQQDFRRTA